jgi:hypothetical protein
MALPGGWLTVEEAEQLPEPNTSWMTDPWVREEFTTWLRYEGYGQTGRMEILSA